MMEKRKCAEGVGWFATCDIPPYTKLITEKYLQSAIFGVFYPTDEETTNKVLELCHDASLETLYEQMASVHSKNSFGARGYSLIYHKTSFFNHSCFANLFYWIDADNNAEITVISMIPIKKDTQLTINYFGNWVIRSDERKTRLLKTWDIECNCCLCTNTKLCNLFDTFVDTVNIPIDENTCVDDVNTKIEEMKILVDAMHLYNTHCIPRKILPDACLAAIRASNSPLYTNHYNRVLSRWYKSINSF